MDDAELERFHALLVGMRDELKAAGDLRLDPNRVDPVAKKDDDGQPLNEMHQAISSSRNRNRAASLRQTGRGGAGPPRSRARGLRPL